MKKILTNLLILIFMLGCAKEVGSQKIKDLDILKAQSYEGYYLKSLQINEDGSYRITLYLPNGNIEVIVSVPKENITIERDKSISAVYKELNNGSLTGRYVIYLQTGFSITNYYI